MCEGNEHSVEKSVSMGDLVFLNRSDQPLDCGMASSLAVGSGRREHQFHLPFPFQLFLCFTLVQMGTCKGPQEPVCNKCEWRWKKARMSESHSEYYRELQLHVCQKIPAWRLSHLPLCLHTVPLSPLQPIPNPVPAAALGPALRKSHCWEEKGNSMNDYFW